MSFVAVVAVAVAADVAGKVQRTAEASALIGQVIGVAKRSPADFVFFASLVVRKKRNLGGVRSWQDECGKFSAFLALHREGALEYLGSWLQVCVPGCYLT